MAADNVRKLFSARPNDSLVTGGGGPHDGGMDARMATLEATVPTLATKVDVSDLRSEMHEGFANMVKWIVGTGIVGIALALTVMTFVLNNAVPKPAATAPTPIVIQVPAPVLSGFNTQPAMQPTPPPPASAPKTP